uniref:E3 ubiquitin-protein ligase TRIM39-like n=1 Tax=Myxine glutinosa TaxID=7769 RepID=UPI00358EED5E
MSYDDAEMTQFEVELSLSVEKGKMPLIEDKNENSPSENAEDPGYEGFIDSQKLPMDGKSTTSVACRMCPQQDLQSGSVCQQCSRMVCSVHLPLHCCSLEDRWQQVTESTEVGLWPEGSPPVSGMWNGEVRKLCTRHGMPLRVYCKEDSKVMCTRCLLSYQHSGHTILSDKQAFEELKDYYSDWLQKLAEIEKERKKRAEELEKRATDVANDVAQLAARVWTHHQTLLSLLEQQRDEMLDALHHQQESTRQCYMNLAHTAHQEAIQAAVASPLMQTAFEPEHEPWKVLQVFKIVQESLNCTENSDGETETAGVETPAEFFSCEIKVSKLLKTFSPTPILITLDPDTAHSNLELSEEDTVVRCMRYQHPVPDNPLRFQSTLNVLGTKGFPQTSDSNGRCYYWEVHVGNKPGWTVGMAYASIPRDGSSRLGRNCTSWALELHEHQYHAWHGEQAAVPCQLSTEAHTIGVFYDPQHGILSFYNAGEMHLIHSFRAEFSEPLFPALNPHSCRDPNNQLPLRLRVANKVVSDGSKWQRASTLFGLFS